MSNMEKFIKYDAVSFDDVMLSPKYSEIKSRSEVDVKVKLSKNIEASLPIVPSNMKTIVSEEMIDIFYQKKSLVVMHRFCSFDEQLNIAERFYKKYGADVFNYLGFSIGVKEEDYKYVDELVELGVKIILIDVAHGDHSLCLDMIKYVAQKYPNVFLIAGNTATYEGTYRLFEAGADMVKVGIGGGCAAEGTRVLMANGTYKNIEDIKVGEKVINMNGKPVKVKNIFNNEIKNVMKLRNSIYYEDMFFTSNHEFYIGDLSSSLVDTVGYAKTLDKLTKSGQSKYKWKALKDINKASFLMPKNIDFNLPETFNIEIQKRCGGNGRWKDDIKYKKDVSLKPSYEVGYLFGTFLGDGHAFVNTNGSSKIGNVSWYFHKNETHIVKKVSKYLKKIFNKSPKITDNKNIKTIRFYYKPLADYLATFGKKDKKHLPENLLVNNKKYLQGLLDGLVDSNGYIEENGRVNLSNTSKQIIELFNITNYLLTGVFPNNQKTKITAGGLKNCNIDNVKQSYISRINTTGAKRLSKNYQVSKILEMSETDLELPTYDIEVDCDTHSFIANNAIVHNSICTTRMMTGNGIPTLSSLVDAKKAKDDFEKATDKKVFILSDGGAKNSGDVVKALCFADMVMTGNLLAGSDECPGDILLVNGETYKAYHGSSTHRGNRTEGVKATVKAKGPVKDIIQSIVEGVQSGCSYQGVNNLVDLKKSPEFVKITHAGMIESGSHDVIVKG